MSQNLKTDEEERQAMDEWSSTRPSASGQGAYISSAADSVQARPPSSGRGASDGDPLQPREEEQQGEH
jgi:hypothetical protein